MEVIVAVIVLLGLFGLAVWKAGAWWVETLTAKHAEAEARLEAKVLQVEAAIRETQNSILRRGEHDAATIENDGVMASLRDLADRLADAGRLPSSPPDPDHRPAAGARDPIPKLGRLDSPGKRSGL